MPKRAVSPLQKVVAHLMSISLAEAIQAVELLTSVVQGRQTAEAPMPKAARKPRAKKPTATAAPKPVEKA